jgi:hypothetical protein
MFPQSPHDRRVEARRIRRQAANFAFQQPHPTHQSNGEESDYPINGKLSYVANYSKGLPHNRFGEVRRNAYKSLLKALASGAPSDFINIQLGRGDVRLVNPQAGLAFDLEGPDAWAVTIPPAPRIDEEENSGEMGELYWMALCRDINFIDYGTGANTDVGPDNTAAAAASLTADFSVFKGPRDPAGNVTPATLFRGFTRGDLIGPYISQFLLKGTADSILNPPPDNGVIRYGTLGIDQRQRTVLAPGSGGSDYLTNFVDWLEVQRGQDRRNMDVFDPTPRSIRNLRDLANYVHFDQLYEPYLNACLLLLNMPRPNWTSATRIGVRGVRGVRRRGSAPSVGHTFSA